LQAVLHPAPTAAVRSMMKSSLSEDGRKRR
jgi:hypothetical protein